MSDQPIKKQVEEAIKCDCAAIQLHTEHLPSCPAVKYRPAVLALLERREQEHAAELLQLEQDHGAKLADWHSLWQSTLTENSERVAQLIAHRACCGTEHDPANGKLHGYCVVCGVPWPCEYAGKPPKQPELGPCGRHGKEFWLAPKEIRSLASHSFPLKFASVPAPESAGYCTACAQEKAERGEEETMTFEEALAHRICDHVEQVGRFNVVDVAMLISAATAEHTQREQEVSKLVTEARLEEAIAWDKASPPSDKWKAERIATYRAALAPFLPPAVPEPKGDV